MNYEAIWKMLSDVITDLRKKGESIPADVRADLRSAKTMIEIFKVDKSHVENLIKIEEYLNKVESYVLPAAKRNFGDKYVEDLMGKIAEAESIIQTWEQRPPQSFPVGVPKGKRWIRLKLSDEIPLEKVKMLSDELELNYRVEADGCIVLFGEDEKIKMFVKKVAVVLHEG